MAAVRRGRKVSPAYSVILFPRIASRSDLRGKKGKTLKSPVGDYNSALVLADMPMA
jgi:hypothetical protein